MIPELTPEDIEKIKNDPEIMNNPERKKDAEKCVENLIKTEFKNLDSNMVKNLNVLCWGTISVLGGLLIRIKKAYKSGNTEEVLKIVKEDIANCPIFNTILGSSQAAIHTIEIGTGKSGGELTVMFAEMMKHASGLLNSAETKNK